VQNYQSESKIEIKKRTYSYALELIKVKEFKNQRATEHPGLQHPDFERKTKSLILNFKLQF